MYTSVYTLSAFLLVNLFLAHGSKYEALCYTIYSEQENIAAVAAQQGGTFNKGTKNEL